MRITFLLPGLGHNVPVGGFKVVYEYANRFMDDGFDVCIVYIADSCYKGESVLMHIYNTLKFFYKILVGFSGKKWFPLKEGVKESCVLYGKKCFLPKSDCYVATSNSTAVNLNKIGYKKESLVYFIQGYETWNMSINDLLMTYHFEMKKIVISNDLHEKLKIIGVDSTMIPNGFNFEEYKYEIPVRLRNKYCINMLYHESEDKGCKYGFKAIEMVKAKYPQLHVVIWGTPSRPSWLPKDYIYYSCPDNALHNRINNESAIFIAPSLNEGWGLTIGEAMMCGEVVVCSNNSGYMELAINEVNALVSPVKDVEKMANNIIKVIEDNDLRWSIAQAGLSFIQNYTWDRSYQTFKKVCLSEK